MAAGNKYRARRVRADSGLTFDSKREYSRWLALKGMEAQGEIQDLKRQVKYTLIPAQRDERGRLLERECSYRADFVYQRDGETIVEDAKGFHTKEYVIKRKLMLQKYGIRVIEV